MAQSKKSNEYDSFPDHHGNRLKKIVYQYKETTGISLTKLAKAVEYDQSTLYRHFDSPVLNAVILTRYARAMNMDLSLHFPEVTDIVFTPSKTTRENPWKDKYIELLEKYSKLLVQYNRLIEKTTDEKL